MTPQPANLAASIHQRLLNHAKAQEVDFNFLLARFAVERFLYRLAASPFNVQVDVGIGDRLTPPAEWIEYPSLLDLPRPRLRAYRPETTIAEKLHAMVVLDLQNSRMKDFFDMFRLAQTHSFAGDSLVAAVMSTFAQRQTPIPQTPTAFTTEFALHPSKVLQWNAFCRRAGFKPEDANLVSVVELIAQFLQPVADAARSESSLPLMWSAGGPWTWSS